MWTDVAKITQHVSDKRADSRVLIFPTTHTTSQTSPQTWSPQRLNFHGGTSAHGHSLIQ